MFIERGIHKHPKAPEGRQVRFVSIADSADCTEEGTSVFSPSGAICL